MTNKIPKPVANDPDYITKDPSSSIVQSWLTTTDQKNLFTPQPPITRIAYDGTTGTRPIVIDATTKYQSMLGFGAAVTDSATYTIWRMPAAARATLMTELFDPIHGHGISVVRLPIGASDFARFNYTYDDNYGKADKSLTNFSIKPDMAYTIPLLQSALLLNPNLTIIASCWSPPTWMKRRFGLRSGHLKHDYYAAYAQYFVKFIQAYAAEGLSIYALTLQNEPKHKTKSYPSMLMTATEQATLISEYLGPALAAAHIDTKILAYDHNWDDLTYSQAVLADSQAQQYIDGVAWHAYAGSVGAQTTVHNAYPHKHTYFTEITASQPGNFALDLKWHMRNIILGAPANWARCTIHWNVALDEHNGPINGGYNFGQGIITVDTASAAITRYAPYYAIIHASAKVQPGAYRISCTSYEAKHVIAVAYLNPDGSKVCIILNDASSLETFKVIENNFEFMVTMQPGDVTTYYWPA
jgi:glucosylceramidase